MQFAIGIDVGGTFTDLVVSDGQGRLTISKAVTTPQDQSEGVLEALSLAAAELGLSTAALLSRTGRIVHGTTVATNALLEGKAAKVGMLTTAGHRDVIEMREGLKPDRYNLRMTPPPPLVPRDLRLGVAERIRADGSVATPLDPASLDTALTQLADAEVDAVAICFLHAWLNPAHEQRAAEAVRARLPDAYVTTSSEVLPRIDEFARFSTTVANAAVGPVIAAYLRRLQARLSAAGFDGALHIILSHGGVATVTEAVRLAAGTALSGPAGGVAAAVALARQGIAPDLVTFDMGGTSTDIALVAGGAPNLAGFRQVGEARIALPALDIVTLGAGGGSIAALGPGGLLQVGPQSAGAVPGPACYGRGGSAPTVTDANVVLGRLDAGGFMGGRGSLDAAAARAAVAPLAAALGISIEVAAAGIVRLVNTRMADGVRIATVRRGVDPRGYTLLAFGGAAGLHVADVAAEIGIRSVVVPLAASVLSAWGMLNTDLRLELSRGLPQTAEMDLAALAHAFSAMEAEARTRLPADAGQIALHRAADMRYGEQVFEITVNLDKVDLAASDAASAVAAAFHRRHEALYTYAMQDQTPVLVTARLSVTSQLPPAEPASIRERAPGTVRMRRRVWLDGGWRQDVPAWDFAALAPAQCVSGPAILEAPTTTLLLRAGDSARLDPRGWLAISVAAQESIQCE